MSFEQQKLLEIVNEIKEGKIKNIIVITGAGISVNAGIPDFRSEKGLYKLIKESKDYTDLTRPEDLFNISFFNKNPYPFYKFMKEFGQGTYKPTLTHYFMRLLADKKVLRRNYTQNIDCLEKTAGIADDLIVTAHGSMINAKCINCKKSHTMEALIKAAKEDNILKCEDCNSYVKPDIVFFGEQLPDNFHIKMLEDFVRKNNSSDFAADLLIVIGTSLTVAPMSLLPRLLPCPKIYINKEEIYLNKDSIQLVGDCDQTVLKLSEMLGWDKDLLKYVDDVKICDKE
jgi:NAD-dependent SIR2 family protein deacetylase